MSAYRPVPSRIVCCRFDVCGNGFLSAIWNMCGDYVSFERSLNQSFLFDTFENADEMRHRADTDAPEHRPFHVFGIYQLAGS